MKQFYLFITLLFTSFIFSQNFTDTKGELQISSSGVATYDLPILAPPSIKNVAPTVSLSYNSSQKGGIAGQGWNINNISAISRIGTRKDIEGFVDGVDFDVDDRLALDGQRLLLKTGTYWASGSTYETEYKSNTKIELLIGGTTTYFIVTAADGSRSWYGWTGSGSLQNSFSLNAWYIVRYEDPNGNFIEYNYNPTGKPHVDSIIFSGNITAGISAQNKIVFNYRDAKRRECEYINGLEVCSYHILSNIQVYSNNLIYKTYRIEHDVDTQLGYERLKSIKEINAQNEESNPVVFNYAPSPVNQERTEKTYTNNLAFDKIDLSGDFDGDGRLDFTINNQMYTNLFNGASGSTPITMPVYTSSERSFAAITLTNNKLNQFKTIISPEVSLTSLTFRYYNLSGGIVSESYSKTVPIPNVVINSSQCSTGGGGGEEESRGTSTSSYEFPETLNLNNQYIEGDFNGDGISDVIILQYQQIDYYGMDMPCTGPGGEAQNCNCILKSTSITTCANGAFYLSLNPNGSTTLDTQDFVFMPDFMFCKERENKFIGDFNGDGKSDILIVDNTTKNYRIVSIRQLLTYPWQAVEIIGTGNLDKYSKTKQILFGDYNADGKVDIMLPDSEGAAGSTLWHIYYSNGNVSGGLFFTRESHYIVEYRPNTSQEVPNPYTTQIHYSDYFAMDINGDGKTDLVRVWKKYYSPGFFDFNNHNTQWQVTGFVNNIGKRDAPGFIATYDSGVFDSGSPEVPIATTSNYRYKGADTDLVLVRGHYNKIEYYQFNKNVGTENRLIEVSESSGNVKQTIEYKPMEALGGGLGNSSNDFYSSENAVTYPNVDIINNYKNYLVSKVTATVNGVSKYKDFRYRSFISNLEYGNLGFAKASRSSWYLSASDTKIWATQFNDVNLRGINTITWSSTNGTTVFDAIPTDLLTSSTSGFQTYINPSSKLFNILLDQKTDINHLTGTKTETTFTYDGTVQSPSYFGLESKSVTKTFSGGTLQGTNTIDKEYYNSLGSGANYYIGRPKKNSASNSTYMEGPRTSSEIYTYTGSNLTKIEKNGHNTYTLVEDMTYDSVGNILTKTVSAPGAPIAAAPRTITNEYDSSKRFVSKITDHQNFSTNFVYNVKGQITQSTDHLGIVTVNTYDNWGKPLTITSQNTSLTPLVNTITYAKLGDGGYTVTTTDNTDGKTVLQYDVLDRPVITSSKGFASGSMVSTQTLYDGLGRKTKESEPYFSSPSQWTEYEYDYLVRPTVIKSPTGKIQSLSYPGLTTTSIDDGRTTSVTADALGNKIQTTDPGGTIDFIYYADGQLSRSNYQGHTVDISIDGWGNKSGMSNSATGLYTYSYDAFGQIKAEINSQGTTSIMYDDFGKPTQKTISGTNTNINTTYVYNSFGQIIGSNHSDNGQTTNNTYEYDNLNRLYKTTESTPFAVFVKELTFDTYGRLDKEISIARTLNPVKSTTTIVKYIYQNGMLWKILDDSTQQVLWQTNSINERGQLTGAGLGNGIAITNTYDQYGYASQFKIDRTSSNPGNILTLTTAFEAKRGNLNSKTNNLFNQNDTFQYDALDRLTEYTNGLGIQQTQAYDDKGRITQNNIGTYEYDGTKIYQNKAITPDPEALGYYSNREGLYNDSMESRTGWALNPYNPQCISFDNNMPHTGKNSVKINTATSGVSVSYVQSDVSIPIDNLVDTQYTFSGWVFSDAPTAQITLFQYNANEIGYYSYVNSASTATLNAWVPIEMTVLVPASVKSLRLRLDVIGIGNVWFDDVKIRKTSDAVTSSRALNVSYNAFKSPVLIEETGVDKVSFNYNDGNDRSSMFYGGLQEEKLLRQFQKHYSADGTMEIKQNTLTGAVEFVTYIGGDVYDAPIVAKSDGVAQNYLYLHRDYQGSILAITNALGAIVEKRLFDAWGSILKVQDGSGNVLAGLTALDRGYTGHEHLQSVGLINMNARLYDPLLHRFLQVDNYIQDSGNTQNYNQYGYVLNNPLKYTDPSGDICEGCGGAPGVDNGGGTGTSTDLAELWRDIGMKDWWNKNVSTQSIDDGLHFLGQNFKSLGNNITSHFRKSIKNEGPPPPRWQTANIQMPTQHSSLGFNWTYLSQGKPGERFIYDFFNGFYTTGQAAMGRGVGDYSMRNLDSSATTTDEAVWGLVGAVSNGTAIYEVKEALVGLKAAKEGTTIVGEGMKRVSVEAAKRPGSVILNDMPKFTGSADQITSQMMTYNRRWILQQMRSGRPLLDIGFDVTRTNPSIFYQMEQNMIQNYLKLNPNAFQMIKL